MYKVIRQAYHQKPQNGWGNRPGERDICIADDIERIRYCRNRICHTDASGMETNLFNESVLDLFGVICIFFYIVTFFDTKFKQNIKFNMHTEVMHVYRYMYVKLESAYY